MQASAGVRPNARKAAAVVQEGDGGTLAVGAGDVEHRRQRALRLPQPGAQRGDPLQPEDVGAGGEGGQAIELRLDGGVIGNGVVRHHPILHRPS